MTGLLRSAGRTGKVLEYDYNIINPILLAKDHVNRFATRSRAVFLPGTRNLRPWFGPGMAAVNCVLLQGLKSI